MLSWVSVEVGSMEFKTVGTNILGFVSETGDGAICSEAVGVPWAA